MLYEQDFVADPALAAFRELARELKLFFHIGSLAVKATSEKAANRSLLIDREGEIVARYDKIHLFDVDLATGVNRLAVPGRDRAVPARAGARGGRRASPRP
mgnify:CR=1 FL=1